MQVWTARVRQQIQLLQLKRLQAESATYPESSHAHPINPDHFPCPVCGSTDFTWGEALTPQVGGLLRFKTKQDGFFKGGRLIKARECNQCGNVLLFTRGLLETKKPS